MHEHDQDTIMALAEGTLSAAATAAAEAEIAACPECLRDLEMQRIALDALSQAPEVYLNATESARLHTHLHRELAIESPRAAPAKAQPAWGRWAGFAFGTAAVFFVAVLALTALLGGGGDDDSAADFTEAAVELRDDVGETTSAATEAAPNTEELAGAADDSFAAATTTAAPETTAAPMAEDGGVAPPLTYYLLEGEIPPDLRSEIIGQLADDSAFFRAADDAVKDFEPEWAACLENETLLSSIDVAGDPQIVGMVTDDSGDDAGTERLLVAFVTPDLEDTVVVLVTLPECEVFEVLP